MMSTLCLRFCYAVGIALVASVSACRAEVEDSVPYTINFQSVLKERKAFGAYRPLSGVQQVQFRLWDAAEGGTLIWGREFPVYCNEEGAFNVMLTDNGTKLGGIAEYLRDAFSSPACWLELTVVGLGEAILPRSPVASVAYALNVQQAATVDAADEGIFYCEWAGAASGYQRRDTGDSGAGCFDTENGGTGQSTATGRGTNRLAVAERACRWGILFGLRVVLSRSAWITAEGASAQLFSRAAAIRILKTRMSTTFCYSTTTAIWM